jgi:hypothetical protein
MVVQAIETGFMMMSLGSFKAQGNEIVYEFIPKISIDAGIRKAGSWLGLPYDYPSQLGMFVELVGRWFKRHWHNPLHSKRALFCSEAIVKILQESSYPGSTSLTPEDTTPQDLLEFLSK